MQQAITWANVDPDLCQQMVSLGHTELMMNLSGFFLAICYHGTHVIIPLPTNNLPILKEAIQTSVTILCIVKQ